MSTTNWKNHSVMKPNGAEDAPSRAVPARTKEEMMEPFRELQRTVNTHEHKESFAQSEGERSGILLDESKQLHSFLLEFLQRLAAEDSELRKKIHAEHQEEFFRLLVSTHLRMIALINEVCREPGEVRTKLAQTHGFLRNSAVLINSLHNGKPARA